ncbi:putative aldo keto [Rosellinia necatrix]|uniref:Putative aldo keto n=1 Tax=Rosellinia necatrix TaxID=77044 RepID=A0A1W2TN23_ROSNE|nr:putative aldo keto [Rosellinia necatrix]
MSFQHPRLMFGGSVLGEDYISVESVEELLILLQSLGINEIDTAALYPVPNMGESERLLGQLGAVAKGFVIGTKILVLSKDANGTLEPAKIRASLDSSRERLRLDSTQKVGVLHCHAPDFTTPIKDQAAALDALHREGLFDKLGVSNFPLDMLTEFIEVCEREGYVKPTVYQGNYNLLSRGHEKLFPALRKHGIRFDAHSPIASGVLSGKLTSGNIEGTRFAKENMIGTFSKMQYDKKELHDAVRYLDSVLEPTGVSKIEAGLRWICYHSQLSPEDGIILGASKPHYLNENVASIRKGPLPVEIVTAIEKAWETLSAQ